MKTPKHKSGRKHANVTEGVIYLYSHRKHTRDNRLRDYQIKNLLIELATCIQNLSKRKA